MAVLTDWSSRLTITKTQIAQLNDEYKGKRKGSMYFKRLAQLESTLKFIRGKVKVLGTEYSIIKCTYNEGVKPKVMFFTNITAEDGKMLVKLRVPTASDIRAENIFPGVPSTEK